MYMYSEYVLHVHVHVHMYVHVRVHPTMHNSVIFWSFASLKHFTRCAPLFLTLCTYMYLEREPHPSSPVFSWSSSLGTFLSLSPATLVLNYSSM